MARDGKLSRGALDGVKVVDLTRYGSGPICTQIMGDMGAEVIKVEPPGGDPNRMSPPLKGDRGGSFAAFNRNKKSMTLDLRTEKGKEVFTRLVKWGDVLVENFRPGTMEKLGFGYEQVRGINPRLVFVSISGFGQTGPYAQRAAFDYIGQAMAGIMSVTGEPGGKPTLCGAIIADMESGYFGAMGALAALYARKETNEGQLVEASMYESLLVSMSNFLVRRALGYSPGRGNFPSAPVGAFRTADDVHIFIAGHDNSHFPYITKLWGHPEMAEDPHYGNRDARYRHKEELNQKMAEWVRARPAAEVEKALDKGGVPYGRVQTVDDLLKDSHLRAREMVLDVDHGEDVLLPLVGPHPKLYGTPSTIRTVSPHIGQHNGEIYHDILGYSDVEIQEMKRLGAL